MNEIHLLIGTGKDSLMTCSIVAYENYDAAKQELAKLSSLHDFSAVSYTILSKKVVK